MWNNFPNLNRTGQIKYLTMQDGTKLRTSSWVSNSHSHAIVVLVNGHREYMEKQSEFISDFLEKGYALYAFDNRGQGLSDRILEDRSKSYAENFDFFSNDLKEIMSNLVMTDPRANELPIYLIGHSMGGHICLRYLHDCSEKIDKVILMAPLIGFNFGKGLTDIIIKSVIYCANWLGFKKSFAFGQTNYLSKEKRLIKQKLLTHDDKRYAAEENIIKSNPELYVGGATFGWLKSALHSIHKINTPHYLDKISTPILVVMAGDDQVISNDAIQKLFSKHDSIKLVTIKGARHEIYRESNLYRDELWREIDDFLTVEQS